MSLIPFNHAAFLGRLDEGLDPVLLRLRSGRQFLFRNATHRNSQIQSGTQRPDCDQSSSQHGNQGLEPARLRASNQDFRNEMHTEHDFHNDIDNQLNRGLPQDGHKKQNATSRLDGHSYQR